MRVLFGVCADRLLGGGHALAPRAALLWDMLPGINLRSLDGVGYRDPAASQSPLRELAPQVANAHNLTDRRTDEGVGADALQDAPMRDGRRWQVRLARSY